MIEQPLERRQRKTRRAEVDEGAGAAIHQPYVSQITLDFSTQWRAHHREGAPDLNVEFRKDLPKTNVGKILRRELRDEMKRKAA